MPDNTPNSPSIPNKQCSKCGDVLPATEEFFYKRASAKDGLRTDCNACRKKYRKKYYEANKEKAIEYATKWNKANPRKVKRYRRKWYDDNKEKVAEKNRKWWKDNPEKSAEYSRKWYKNNPEKAREKRRRWHWKNKEKENAYSRKWHKQNKEHRAKYSRRYREENKEKRKRQWRRWYKRNKARALANGRRRRAKKLNAEGSHTNQDIERQYRNQGGRCWWCQEEVGDDYHVDHRIPLSRGGSDAPSNIVISCPPCNQSKHTKMPHEWCGRLL